MTGFGQLLEEARRYGQEQDVIVILFIDEFHKLADISPNLLESIKPKLEKSAMNGFAWWRLPRFRNTMKRSQATGP